MRICGAKGVPSLKRLRKKQAELTRQMGLKPKEHLSALGHSYHMNHAADLLALDFANPMVRPHLNLYPVETKVVSETFQADKWLKEVDGDALTPMWADWEEAPYRHFYVNELALRRDGTFVIPLRWLVVENVVHAECYPVVEDREAHIFHVQTGTKPKIPAKELQYNLVDIKNVQGPPRFTECMPNPIRKIANGKPAFSIRIMPWADDVSGNRSKQYNAHTNIYLANLSIPHAKLAQEYFIRFCSTSPDTCALEQFEGMMEDFNGRWHPAFDCQLGQDIIFSVHPHLFPADNPQAQELCSHAGDNHGCRRDLMGGTIEEKETDEGYHAHFSPGVPRSQTDTVAIIHQQFAAAALGVAAAVERIQTDTGIKDRVAQIWIKQMLEKSSAMFKDLTAQDSPNRHPDLRGNKLKGEARKAFKQKIKEDIQEQVLKWVVTQPPERYAALPENSPLRESLRPGDHYNCLMNCQGADPHPDTPLEILHSKLLGDDKYAWFKLTDPWDKKKDEIFATRLQSSNVDGLTIPALRARYILRYKNSLIGKHFKSLQQLAAFHFHEDLCDSKGFDLWKATAELGALLWYPEIDDIDQYLDDLQVLVDNALDIWSMIDPTKILTKVKLHQFTHLKDDIKRFGPAVIFSTEVFECWNAIFRMCSILSNHNSPSRDIAVKTADMERVKHQLSGGWWKNNAGTYVQCGHAIRNFMNTERSLQRRIGWASPAKFGPGSVKLLSKKARRPVDWKEGMGRLWSEDLHPVASEAEAQRKWDHCKFVVAQSGDPCFTQSWIFFKDNATSEVLAGRIFNILQLKGSTTVRIIVEGFNVSGINDPRMNMPVLSPSNRTHIITAQAILFKYNAQHDCKTCKCTVTQGSAL
ncbi:hypothetical protein SISNIDRAFT_414520 [Sistotremastrum niveocremeum HHB9708]|uniref:Uncharacterized protein n=1 Tax=Sistotremastrum niveocremeum HHB9708 TaxID=1314777 RepID=A0A164RZG4_9AGAM|nr:hypothetical protein SISNIDRAFT_414520 [Sistotremastrum niveocremeum HHB9708]